MKFNIYKSKSLSLNNIVDDYYNKKIILLLQILGASVLLYVGRAGIEAILSGNTITYIRYTLRTQIIYNGNNGMLLSYIGQPIMYFSIPYTFSQFQKQRKDSYFYFSCILTIMMIILELFTIGGRLTILYTLVCAFIEICLFRKSIYKLFGIKYIVVLSFFVVFCIYMLIAICADRGSNVIESTIIYLYASPIFCDKCIEKFLSNNYNYAFGFVSFQGFLRPVFKLLGLDKTYLITNSENIFFLIDKFIYLKNVKFNSEATLFGYLYFDYGLIGVILLSILLGYISQKCYNNTMSKKTVSISDICFLMAMTGFIALTFIQNLFSSVGFALSLVLIYLLSKFRIIGRKK